MRVARWSIGRAPVLVYAATAAAIVFVFALQEDVFWGDPDIYRSRLVDAWESGFPFTGAVFEHLPGMIVPMGAAWLLGGFASVLAYRWVFMGLMAICLYATFDRVEASGIGLGIRNAGLRWLAIAGPLFPLVLFRSDPWVTALAAGAMAAAVAGDRGRERLLGWGAVASKGWPVALAVGAWLEDRRAAAFGYVAVLGGTLVLVLSLPGFRSGRSFSGVHSETVFGSLLLLGRTAFTQPLGLRLEAGAYYADAPVWAVLVGPALALTIAWPVLGAVRRRSGRTAPVPTIAAFVVAILVASPLFSPQFVLWATPFLALVDSLWVRRLALAVTALTVGYMIWWSEMLGGSVLLLGVLLVRNVLLVALGAVTAVFAARAVAASEP